MHARRLRLYRAEMDGKEVEEDQVKEIEYTEAVYHDALGLHAIRMRLNVLEVQVKWEGLPEKTDWIWEPLLQIHEDIPILLLEFLESRGNRQLKEGAPALISSI